MRGIKCQLIVYFLLGTVLIPLSSYATGFPVVDIASVSALLQNLSQLEKEYDTLKNTYDNAKEQLDQAKALTQDAEGHYGFGGLENGLSDLKDREWSPDNWQSTLKGLSGGNTARYQELVKAYKKEHPVLSQEAYQKGASQDQVATYKQDISVNRAAQVNATYAFDTIKTHLKTIHTLSDKIEQAKNTKAAMDLNSRLIAEVAYIQTQELKMQVLMNQQVAQVNADTIGSKSARAKFNTLPN